ncbi:MAG: hypothetical protein IPM97_00090 [Bdellovibrionaceae bacterium]|nr:hypothetical protein [Pseudobdellovibrionaceae bacterium]
MIYTNNEYESKDLDFISSSDIKDIEKALTEIGFSKSSGRHFTHPETEYFVEFPQTTACYRRYANQGMAHAKQ